MSFPNVLDANEPTIVRIVRNIARAEFAEFWRELVRPVTLFDLCSPWQFSSIEKLANSLGDGAPAATRTR